MIWDVASRAMGVLPAEAAHRLTIYALSCGIAPSFKADSEGDLLAIEVAGLKFANPLGIAAGFDKNAEVIAQAMRFGFGAIEVGTITPKPQKGNPKPRVFRLKEDGAVINRYGFNNHGMEAVSKNLASYRARYQHKQGILGVNIGANKDSSDQIKDYYHTAKCLAPYADYVTVNVSSPNTPALRRLQQGDLLAQVLDMAHAGMSDAKAVRPLMLKLAPDLDDKALEVAIRVAVDKKCAGLIISNTTTLRPSHLKSPHRFEEGGLSGAPLFTLATEMLYKCRRLTPASMPLIAAGGVMDAKTAYVKILVGASLVQLYTAFALKGMGLPTQIQRDLATLLRRDGFASITEAIGTAKSLNEAYQCATIEPSD